jgi:hypothetical protein
MSEQSACIGYTCHAGHEETVHFHDALSGVRSERRFGQTPRWLSTDLRESNQGARHARQRLKAFELLSQVGCTEIEVGCPAASDDHLEFVWRLIAEDRIPPDTQISVLTPARTDLIDRTVASLTGAARAIVHLCDADSPLLGHAFPAGNHAAAASFVAGAVDVMRAIGPRSPSCALALEFSLEAFTDTELHVALEACLSLADVWQPEPGRELILNFSADMRRAAPSMFADQVEWFGRHLASRQHTCLSVYPRNEADTGVAAAELALLAGARRVAGCLIGHGTRTRDINLARLGMKLLSHGVDPELDLSRLSQIRYSAGPAAMPAYRGADVARVMRAHGLDLPAGLLAEFAALVQARADPGNGEMPADQIWDLFEREYMVREPASVLLMRCSASRAETSPADPWFALFRIRQSIRTAEENPALMIAGMLTALGLDVVILSRHAQVMETSGLTVVFVHCLAGARVWGAGVGGDLTAASLKAVLSAVNRAELTRPGAAVPLFSSQL